MTLRLATRRSPLALVQAKSSPDDFLLTAESRASWFWLRRAATVIRATDLSILGGQGVFAVEVQRAVLAHDADVAVHSAKDLPSITPEGLVLASVPERLDASDVLVGRSLAGLGPGARVATGSPRRRALLLERRPDVEVVQLRGNMATRLAHVGHDGVDAIVTALAALDRLGESRPRQRATRPRRGSRPKSVKAPWLSRREAMTPATLAALDEINVASAFLAVTAERAYLEELGAGCAIPTGAHATVRAGLVTLQWRHARRRRSQERARRVQWCGSLRTRSTTGSVPS